MKLFVIACIASSLEGGGGLKKGKKESDDLYYKTGRKSGPYNYVMLIIIYKKNSAKFGQGDHQLAVKGLYRRLTSSATQARKLLLSSSATQAGNCD